MSVDKFLIKSPSMRQIPVIIYITGSIDRVEPLVR